MGDLIIKDTDNVVPELVIDLKDYSELGCDLNDENMSNDCWNCLRFCFPIGCMVGNE